jgi:hypothetical protein
MGIPGQNNAKNEQNGHQSEKNAESNINKIHLGSVIIFIDTAYFTKFSSQKSKLRGWVNSFSHSKKYFFVKRKNAIALMYRLILYND